VVDPRFVCFHPDPTFQRTLDPDHFQKVPEPVKDLPSISALHPYQLFKRYFFRSFKDSDHLRETVSEYLLTLPKNFKKLNFEQKSLHMRVEIKWH
jgi:hypothetical protein